LYGSGRSLTDVWPDEAAGRDEVALLEEPVVEAVESAPAETGEPEIAWDEPEGPDEPDEPAEDGELADEGEEI